jgi:hypothetical protein
MSHSSFSLFYNAFPYASNCKNIIVKYHILSGEPVKNDEPEKRENPCGDPSSGRPPNRRNKCDVSWPNIIL